MPIAQDMKRLGEDIVASYDTRIAAVGNIVEETGGLLKRFDKEHKAMAAGLRRDLTNGEDERLKSFKALLTDIQKQQKAREAEVAGMLKTFQKELKDMATALKEMLEASEDTRLKEFKATMTGIQKRIKEINEEVSSYLVEVKDDMTAAAEAWMKRAGHMTRARHGVAVRIKKGKPISAGIEVKKVAEEEKAPKKKGKRGRPKKRK